MDEYKPFKMKGHTLPGINQRSEGNTDLPDGRSGSSPFQKHVRGHDGFGDEKLKGLTRETYGDNRSKKKSLRETIDAKKREVFGKSTKAYKLQAKTRPEKLNPKVEGKIKVLHKARTSPDPKTNPYAGLKTYKRVVTKRRPTETLTARLKPGTIEKAMKEATPYEGFKKEGKKVGMKRDMTKTKKKTGKISTKTMELE